MRIKHEPAIEYYTYDYDYYYYYYKLIACQKLQIPIGRMLLLSILAGACAKDQNDLRNIGSKGILVVVLQFDLQFERL